METITKIGYKNYRIDITAQKLTFLDSRFYYSEDGSFVPSVSTLLEAYPKGAAFYEWLKKNGEDSDAIRDEAGRRGSLVHGLTERYDNGEEINLINENGNIDLKISEWSMLEKYVEFRAKFSFEILSTEQMYVSTELGFAGTLDRIIKFNGKTVLVDIKTSGSIWPSYWLQLAAYKKLVEHGIPGSHIDQVAILWLNAKTRGDGTKGAVQGKGWQLIFRDDTTKDWELFKATQQLWNAENGDSTPKQITYKLKHQLYVNR